MMPKTRALVATLSRSIWMPEPIYEFGSLQVEGQGGYADLRPMFPGREFVGCDARPGPGVDRVMDLHALQIPDESAGTIICMDTLEHVERPWEACQELHRVLKRGGVMVLVLPMKHQIHAHPNDYWRFTQEGVKVLLGQPGAKFDTVVTGQVGEWDFPESVAAVAWKGVLAAHRYTAENILAWWNQLDGTPPGRPLRSRMRDFVPVGLINHFREKRGEHRI